MDWAAWGERAQQILTTSAPEGAFRTLFAPGAEFSDPVNGPTTDIDSIEAMTRQVYPDWRQEIVAVHGDEKGEPSNGSAGGRSAAPCPPCFTGAPCSRSTSRAWWCAGVTTST